MEDIVATRELLEGARPDDIGVSVSYPLPGTKFHQIVKAQLGVKTRWQESNDLEMMFHGTYTSDFYRMIRGLLHEQVSLQTGFSGLGENHAAREDAARAARLLERRWRELLTIEAKYRSPYAQAAMS
jgi:anaerobic magnesium-protoporphyrin IX monomethyl ester cyclase